jgi:hypothetical protein
VQDDPPETEALPKKTAHAAEQQRPDVAKGRSEWKAKQSDFDANRLVFLDESGVNTGMTPGSIAVPSNTSA